MLTFAKHRYNTQSRQIKMLGRHLFSKEQLYRPRLLLTAGVLANVIYYVALFSRFFFTLSFLGNFSKIIQPRGDGSLVAYQLPSKLMGWYLGRRKVATFVVWSGALDWTW